MFSRRYTRRIEIVYQRVPALDTICYYRISADSILRLIVLEQTVARLCDCSGVSL